MALHLEPGATLKHYRIVGLLGRGGMGEVYAAEDTRLGRKVAIKILPATLAGDPERLLRFTQEAKAASALNHPSILTIYDVDEVEGQPFLVTEFIDGRTLRERLRGGHLTIRDVVEIGGQLAGALGAAHAAGIVHRDVKPENIMLREDGHAKLLDFGLAKIAHDNAGSTDETMLAVEPRTTPGIVMGTTGYMSPEQARGMPVDARSDIFSLGVVLHEMAAGRPPFHGETPSDVIASILRADPPAIAGVPSELEHTLRKALEKDRDERHQTAKDLAAELRRLRRHLDQAGDQSKNVTAAGAQSGIGAAASSAAAAGASVSHPTPASAVSAARSRRRLIAAGIAAVVIIGVIGVAGFTWRTDLGRWLAGGTGKGSASGIPNFEGMTIEKVNGLGATINPVMSPDGKLLAYLNLEGPESTIWLRQMATGSAVKVVGPTSNALSNLQFTPDNNFLYYNERPPSRPFRYTLMAVPAFGGTAREIAEGRFGRVSFSPDGKRLATVRNATAAWEVVVMSADGSGTPSVIATRPKSDSLRQPSWSPSGEELAVLATEAVAGGFKTVIQFMRPDGTGMRTVTPSGTPTPQLLDLEWTASSDALVSMGGAAGEGIQLLLIRASDGHVQWLTNDVTGYDGLSVSRGSGVIATVQHTMMGSIWVGPAARPEEAKELPGRLTDGDGFSGLAWVNERELVFARDSKLWMMNDDGTGARRLTERSLSFFPRVSRNGRVVLFMDIREAGALPEVGRLTLPDGRLASVPNVNGRDAAPSPDGRLVFFRRLDETPPAQVLRVPLDGGPTASVFEAALIFNHDVSPDGRELAVIATAGAGMPRTLSLQPLDGGPSRVIFTTNESLDYIRWYPSGDALLLRMFEKDQTNLYRLDRTGGPARQLTHFTRGIVSNPAISPDGSRIAYSRANFETNIVLLKPKSH